MSSLGNSVAKKFGYADKELEEDLGLNTIAYGWRDYDPAIGRFNKIDRFSEKYMDKTPYHFTDNNPIAYTEIAGDSIAAEFFNKKGKRIKTIPKAIQKMFNEEFGIKVGYNSKTRQLYYIEDVESELSQSKDATKQLKSALQDDNDGFEHGMIVVGYSANDSVSGQIISGGSWTSNTTTINLSAFDSDGNYNLFDFNDVNPRSFNLGRVFEHEYLGHQSRRSSRDGNAFKTGPVVDIVNRYRRQRGLDERLNYGDAFTPIFFGSTSSYSSPKEMRREVKKMINGQIKNSKKLTRKKK